MVPAIERLKWMLFTPGLRFRTQTLLKYLSAENFAGKEAMSCTVNNRSQCGIRLRQAYE